LQKRSERTDERKNGDSTEDDDKKNNRCKGKKVVKKCLLGNDGGDEPITIILNREHNHIFGIFYERNLQEDGDYHQQLHVSFEFSESVS